MNKKSILLILSDWHEQSVLWYLPWMGAEVRTRWLGVDQHCKKCTFWKACGAGRSPSCRGDEGLLGSCFARWLCCLEHSWGLSSFLSIASLIGVSLIIMLFNKCSFYLICTFSCVDLRFCSRCLPLRSLTSLFPLQTGLQTCGVMLKLLQRCKMFLLILCVISKLFYKLQLAMAMTTFIIISS